MEHILDVLVLTVLGKARLEYICGELALVVLRGVEVAKDPEVPAILLAALFNELDQGDEVAVLRQQALERKEELIERLNKGRSMSWLAHALDLVVG